MNQNPLNIAVEYLKGVGPRRAEVLNQAGVATLGDLLEYRPRRYLDRSTVRRIRDILPDEEVTVVGTVISKRVVRGGKRRLLVRIEDGSGVLEGVWFQQADAFARMFKENQLVAFSGKVVRYHTWQIAHPSFDILSEESDPLNTGQIIPVYPSGQELKKVGLSNFSLRRIIHTALQRYGRSVPETLPPYLVRNYRLLSRQEAYSQMHFPESMDQLSQVGRRFKFEELFYLQLLMALRKHFYVSPISGFTISSEDTTYRRLLDALPFRLTKAQLRVLEEIRRDLAGGHPMNRLVQGDVGSGKTVVALLAMFLAISGGYQAALMAPTEILAQQHFFNLSTLLAEEKLRLALLIGSMPEREKQHLQQQIAAGEIDLVVGTHALIQEAVDFDKLGIAVIDEQHRFGVMQRASLIRKGRHPHVLVLTATPIPRTLALTIYGDLDVSVIDELPPGRQQIQTYWRTDNSLNRVYPFIREQLAAGQQAYVVYPLVEASEKLDLKAATETYHYLQKQVFPNYRLALLHGRLKMAEKEAIMADFKRGSIHMLIATTVIEVGVDVPTATVMMIEHAERFGLSQLHQLRGRVGRGRAQSYCILITPPEINDVAKARMMVMTKTNDGFVIAEEDLRLRGSGEFFGTRQHGMPDLKYADLVTDQKIVQTARKDAFAIIAKDPHLRLPQHDAVRTHFKEEFAGKFDMMNIA